LNGNLLQYAKVLESDERYEEASTFYESAEVCWIDKNHDKELCDFYSVI